MKEENEISEKKARVQAELKRLSGIYTKLDARRKKIIDGLIRRAAYMRVTLEDYEEDLDENGYIEMFSQSEKTDAYERERPVARLYNTMNKNYQCIIKQLTDMLPKEEIKTEEDGFDKFVHGREDT